MVQFENTHLLKSTKRLTLTHCWNYESSNRSYFSLSVNSLFKYVTISILYIAGQRQRVLCLPACKPRECVLIAMDTGEFHQLYGYLLFVCLFSMIL